MLIECVQEPIKKLDWILLLPNLKLFLTCKRHSLEKLMRTYVTFEILRIPNLFNQLCESDNKYMFQVNIVKVRLPYTVKQAEIPKWLDSTQSLNANVDIVCEF